MKLLLLADANSAHTVKWATGLSEWVDRVMIFTLSSYNEDLYSLYDNISVFTNSINSDTIVKENGNFQKLSYLRTITRLKRIIRDEKPDILHAHYASSYGLLGVLAGFKPLVTSVWGSDVFSFPKKSILHRSIFKYNLSKANKVLSTSQAMANEIAKYSSIHVDVVPFGIDTKVFEKKEVRSEFDKNEIVIGTIKSLEKVYRIDRLIQVFSKLHLLEPDLPLKLLIVGGGSLRKEMEQLVESLEITHLVKFVGKVEHKDIVQYYNQLDVFVALSESESFGVSVIEASACEVPVVVSNVGGFFEVVDNDATGYIVPGNDTDFIAEKIETLVNDKELRISMGKKGRTKVVNEYEFSKNLQQMLKVYKDVLK